MMIAEFDRMAVDLDREIAAEEQKAGIADPNHFAYPTYARAAAQRRDNLRLSAQNLHIQLDDAKAELGVAFEELKRAESLEDRERSLDAAISQAGQGRVVRATA
jgi:flagellar FliJ protein